MSSNVDIIPNVKIKKINKAELKTILKKLDNQQLEWSSPGFSKLPILEALSNLRYEFTDEGDHWQCESFNGQKLGDDEEIWKALAPVVEEDSSLSVIQENIIDDEDLEFKYTFKNNKLVIE